MAAKEEVMTIFFTLEEGEWADLRTFKVPFKAGLKRTFVSTSNQMKASSHKQVAHLNMSASLSSIL